MSKNKQRISQIGLSGSPTQEPLNPHPYRVIYIKLLLHIHSEEKYSPLYKKAIRRIFPERLSHYSIMQTEFQIQLLSSVAMPSFILPFGEMTALVIEY